MQFSFQKSAWDESALTHAYTHRLPYTNRFTQLPDCIENTVKLMLSYVLEG